MQTVYIHNTAVGANTNFFTPVGPTNAPSTFRIFLTVTGTTPIINVQRTNAATTVVENLNAGSAVITNAAYIFDVLVAPGDTISIQSTAAVTIQTFVLRELPQ